MRDNVLPDDVSVQVNEDVGYPSSLDANTDADVADIGKPILLPDEFLRSRVEERAGE